MCHNPPKRVAKLLHWGHKPGNHGSNEIWQLTSLLAHADFFRKIFYKCVFAVI